MEPSKLAEALSKAQLKIQPPRKTRNVDFTDKQGRRVKYSYADLADLIECIRQPLGENGLAIVHQLEVNEGVYCLKTTLLHVSGEQISSWYPLPDPSSDIRPQEFGSALTYARRYSLSGLLGVASEEDDDGQAAAPPKKAAAPPLVKAPVASGGITPKKESEPPGPQNSGQTGPVQPAPRTASHSDARPPVVTAPMLARLFTLASKNGWTQEKMRELMMDHYQVTSSKDLTREQYDQLTTWLETRKP